MPSRNLASIWTEIAIKQSIKAILQFRKWTRESQAVNNSRGVLKTEFSHFDSWITSSQQKSFLTFWCQFVIDLKRRNRVVSFKNGDIYGKNWELHWHWGIMLMRILLILFLTYMCRGTRNRKIVICNRTRESIKLKKIYISNDVKQKFIQFCHLNFGCIIVIHHSIICRATSSFSLHTISSLSWLQIIIKWRPLSAPIPSLHFLAVSNAVMHYNVSFTTSFFRTVFALIFFTSPMIVGIRRT